ncbi:MAG: DUF790 family protein [Deltaproteobacteria bacterium]|nr:DUF790 family protein [Deltaproteobacteria bacterium]
MLTGVLLRARLQGGRVLPRYLDARAQRRLLPVAERLVTAIERLRGAPRFEVEAALDEVPVLSGDRVAVLGLRKLLLDRATFIVAPGPPPAEVRAKLFWLAAARRRELGPGEKLERSEVVGRAAAELGTSPAKVEQRLFADLRENELLVSFRRISAEGLLGRYNVSLAQGVLLRATSVAVELGPQAPALARQMFRAARFHGLLHQVTAAAGGGWRIVLDGPLSLFSSVERYGLRLGMFLPAVLRCAAWRLEAEFLWGQPRRRARFELGPEQGLVPFGPVPSGPSPEIAELAARFAELGSRWQVEPADAIIALPGEPVCIPDLVFRHGDTGEEILLEAFGFWSRRAVWQRIETIRRGFPGRIILAVGKQLRVSDELLGEEDAGELYVYRTTPSAREILRRLEAGAATSSGAGR